MRVQTSAKAAQYVIQIKFVRFDKKKSTVQSCTFSCVRLVYFHDETFGAREHIGLLLARVSASQYRTRVADGKRDNR